MSDILIRDVDPEALKAIKARAARGGRSMQAELRHVIEELAEQERRRRTFWERADALRAASAGTEQTDSADLIREDRDSDHGREW